MAEGKGIEIKIATIGGDQAASEIRKVETSVGGLSKEGGKLSAAAISMRTGLMNVGYQVQDFAVQVASGTSASRAFAQQAPQLLSGFGLIGVAAGTAVAIGAPFLEQLLGFSEAADDAGAAFDDMAGRMSKAASAKTKLETNAWVETLSAEEDAIRKQNEELDRNRKLLESKLTAQGKLDAAKFDKSIAEIDADESLTEEQKIRNKAGVKERQERKAVEDRVNAEGRAVTADEADAKAKAEAAKRIADDAARISAEKAATEKELVEAERRERLRQAANRDLPQAKDELTAADKKEFIWGANPLRSDADKADSREEARTSRLRVEQLENQATADPGNTIRTAELRTKKQALEAAEAKAREDAAKAATDAERAGLDAAARRNAFESNKTTSTETYQTESEARKIRTDASAAAAAKRKKDQDAAQKREKDQDENRAELAGIRGAGAAAKIGRDAEKLLPDGVKKEFRDAVTKAARGLQDGDQGGEIKELIGLMNQLANASAVKGSQTAGDIQELRRSIAIMQGQIKNNRSGQ